MKAHSQTSPPVRGPWIAPRLKPFLLALSIFLSGVLVGSVFTSGYVWRQTLQVLFVNPQVATEDMLLRTRTGLRLSPAESERLDAAFQRFHTCMKGLRLEIAPRVQQGLDELKKDVGQVLDAEQAEEWNRRFEELRARFFPPAR